MWTLKIEIDCSKWILGSRTKKFDIRALTYPISYHHYGNKIYVYGILHLFGNDLNKKEFVKDLKKDPRFVSMEQNDDILIGQIIEDSRYSPTYGPGVFPIEPVYIDHNGQEVWTLGSWKKEELVKISQLAEKYHKEVLLKFKQSKVKYASILNVLPNLSEKQKQAMDLAIRAGYYNFPKKIRLIELANEMKVSYSTFQAHLKKAEKKLIPHIFRKASYNLDEINSYDKNKDDGKDD